ncbi:MAG: ornithine aminomutase subunit alpha [Clostridia bacterium]|nr:ornithine aminomutase subunit alpha [Clostridia bacterium]
MKRADDFQARRAHLAPLSDEALHARFWSLCGEIVDPLIELGRENTTPAIERSVLLRMGFNSLEAKAIVEGCVARGLLAHGAGNVVYRLAKSRGVDIRAAGAALLGGGAWDEAAELFGGAV